jgi:hypothetical protein
MEIKLLFWILVAANFVSYVDIIMLIGLKFSVGSRYAWGNLICENKLKYYRGTFRTTSNNTKNHSRKRVQNSILFFAVSPC